MRTKDSFREPVEQGAHLLRSGLPLSRLPTQNRGFPSRGAKWETNGWTVKMMSAESARTSFYFCFSQRLAHSDSSPLWYT